MSWAWAEPRSAALRLLLPVLLCVSAPVAVGAEAQESGLTVGEAQEHGDAEVRRSYVEHWRQLSRDGQSGLERFASTVQLVVDTRSAMNLSSRDEAVRAILDDLVDLFVGPEYALEKSLTMLSAPVLDEHAITEEEYDLSGFAPRFRAGEGRFRHFALNAAASYAIPETLVSLAALLRGRDLASGSPESAGDRAADIATNRIGRAFTRLLRERPFSELREGAVHDWIVERFGDG